MDTTSYNIALITRDGVRMDAFDASIPSSKHGYDIPVGEQVATVAKLMGRGVDHLFNKSGRGYCHNCGKEAKLYQNNFKSHILDAVSALCGHGVCEVQAVQFRKDMLTQLATRKDDPPVTYLSPCVVVARLIIPELAAGAR